MRRIVDNLTPPVDLDSDHWRGGERAPVTLVEYGDYECRSAPRSSPSPVSLAARKAGDLGDGEDEDEVEEQL